MRKAVIQEGVDILGRWIVDPGALKAPERELTIHYAYDTGLRGRLGVARDMVREADGNITFDLQFDDPIWQKWLEDDLYDISVFVHQMKGTEEPVPTVMKSRLRVHSGTIGYISVVPLPGWPTLKTLLERETS